MTQKQSASPWVRQHQPKSAADVFGQDKAIAGLRSFITGFKPNKKKAVLAYGPAGCGKTCSVYAIAADLGLEVLELNASDFRDEKSINSVVGNAARQMSLFSRGKVILVDELDGVSGSKDRGGVAALTRLISESAFPIVMTANDPWDKRFSSLRKKAVMIEFAPLSYSCLQQCLQSICEKERIGFDEQALRGLARHSAGDVRGAINDLQLLSQLSRRLTLSELNELSERSVEEGMSSALIKVFKPTDPAIAISAFDNVSEQPDRWFLWVDENVAREYTRPEDLARAYDAISRADVFFGRIKRWQYWRFLVYINALLTAGVAVAKDERYKTPPEYRETKRLLKLWMANMRYKKRERIAQKIAERTHDSASRAIKDTIPYLKNIFRKSPEEAGRIAEELELDSEEIEWLTR